jgi:hypothetical protein
MGGVGCTTLRAACRLTEWGWIVLLEEQPRLQIACEPLHSRPALFRAVAAGAPCTRILVRVSFVRVADGMWRIPQRPPLPYHRVGPDSAVIRRKAICRKYGEMPELGLDRPSGFRHVFPPVRREIQSQHRAASTSRGGMI